MNASSTLSTTALSKMRVMVVDDDRDTTECMRLLFKHWGHEVHVANEGAVAIEQAPIIRPDLMLIDLAMPKVNGLQVAREVRQVSELLHTSLVAVTGFADTPHREQALAAGFDECLVKPLPADQLLALLDRVRSRIAASQERTALALEAAATSRQLKANSLPETRTAGPLRAEATPVRIEKSGISDIVLLEDRATADRLRQWLRERGCRVGPVFEASAGQSAFFNYSRRQMRTLLRDHSDFRIAE
jgi:CheY-like chemotaxis protein